MYHTVWSIWYGLWTSWTVASWTQPKSKVLGCLCFLILPNKVFCEFQTFILKLGRLKRFKLIQDLFGVENLYTGNNKMGEEVVLNKKDTFQQEKTSLLGTIKRNSSFWDWNKKNKTVFCYWWLKCYETGFQNMETAHIYHLFIAIK